MSFLVTRLWIPVPSISPISIACSWAILRRSRRGFLARLADHTHDRIDRDGLALRDLDLEKRPGDGRGDLGVDFVGRDLEDRLVALDRIPDLLEPLGDGPLGDRFPHLGHD